MGPRPKYQAHFGPILNPVGIFLAHFQLSPGPIDGKARQACFRMVLPQMAWRPARPFSQRALAQWPHKPACWLFLPWASQTAQPCSLLPRDCSMQDGHRPGHAHPDEPSTHETTLHLLPAGPSHGLEMAPDLSLARRPASLHTWGPILRPVRPCSVRLHQRPSCCLPCCRPEDPYLHCQFQLCKQPPHANLHLPNRPLHAHASKLPPMQTTVGSLCTQRKASMSRPSNTPRLSLPHPSLRQRPRVTRQPTSDLDQLRTDGQDPCTLGKPSLASSRLIGTSLRARHARVPSNPCCADLSFPCSRMRPFKELAYKKPAKATVKGPFFFSLFGQLRAVRRREEEERVFLGLDFRFKKREEELGSRDREGKGRRITNSFVWGCLKSGFCFWLARGDGTGGKSKPRFGLFHFVSFWELPRVSWANQKKERACFLLVV